VNILWLKTGPLYPLDTGGKKRTHHMLCEIARDNHVTYLALKDDATPLHPAESNAPYAQEKIWIPWKETPRTSLRFYAELFRNFIASTMPYSLAKYRSREYAAAIDQLCSERNFDLIICDFLYPAVNLRNREHKPPTVLFQHNMEAQVWKRLADGKKSFVARQYFRNQFRRMHRWEKRLSLPFDCVITVSPEDTHFARHHYQLKNIAGDVPTGVDPDYFKPSPAKPESDRTVIGFLGSMDWMPNIEAVLWFVEEVFALVKAGLPQTELHVIGRRPPRSILALSEQDPSIKVTGTVEDVRPYLEQCDILVVPLLSGGGTRIKIMEALAAGLPVVSTTIGAEGLGLIDGEHILIADDPPSFAKQILSLARDPAQRARIATKGRELVQAQHGWESTTAHFLRHCRSALHN
jgi:glycosyltransferase involved in cell wall biosynthesis